MKFNWGPVNSNQTLGPWGKNVECKQTHSLQNLIRMERTEYNPLQLFTKAHGIYIYIDPKPILNVKITLISDVFIPYSDIAILNNVWARQKGDLDDNRTRAARIHLFLFNLGRGIFNYSIFYIVVSLLLFQARESVHVCPFLPSNVRSTGLQLGWS